jgi:hypothetical protein
MTECMNYEDVYDDVKEAAKDVLLPLIDQGVFTGSRFDIGKLAGAIADRWGELMAASDRFFPEN